MRMPQGVASLALGYVLHWAFSPPLLNQKLGLSIRFMVVYAIWFSTKVKCCKGNTKTLHPSKKVYNLYTNICFLALTPLVNECVCFYCHLTLFVRNKLIINYFKSVR